MWWGTPRDSTTGRMRAETNAARVTHQIARNEETPNQKTNGMLKFHGRGVCQSEFAFSRVFPPPCPPGIVRSHLRIRGSSAGLRPPRVSANRPDHVRLHLRRAPSSVFFPWLVGRGAADAAPSPPSRANMTPSPKARNGWHDQTQIGPKMCKRLGWVCAHRRARVEKPT